MAERKFVGKFRHGVSETDVPQEYYILAKEDEAVARFLYEDGRHYRQAAYFAVQSMEKYVRYKIFSLASARHQAFREATLTHDLDKLLGFLIEISTSDENKRAHVKDILDIKVLEKNRFGKLHNNLRYPKFSEDYGTHSILVVRKRDAAYALELLGRVKDFADSIHTSAEQRLLTAKLSQVAKGQGR